MPSPSSPKTHEEKPKEKPFDSMRIFVAAEPTSNTADGRCHADRIAAHLKSMLEKAVAEAAPTGIRSQFVAIQEEMKRASQQIDPGTIVALKAVVYGKLDDASHYREYHASPPLPRTA